MRTRNTIAALIACAAALGGCGARSSLRGTAYEGDGGANGSGGAACEPSGDAKLAVRIRDFHDTHPDFEKFFGEDPGIVEPLLGEDGTPVYAGLDGNPTTSGKEGFDQWYHDVPGVNLGVDRELSLEPIPNGVAFETDAFFPIDDELFGDEGREHNFHFTLAGHTTFRYQGGESFAFAGDDDFFAFIAGRLVIDLGGVHSSEGSGIDIDDVALPFGLETGEVYSLDVFFAERHTEGSTFHVRLAGFRLCE